MQNPLIFFLPMQVGMLDLLTKRLDHVAQQEQDPDIQMAADVGRVKLLTSTVTTIYRCLSL
jgi:hypothetical protein